jgi:hypothetical protein
VGAEFCYKWSSNTMKGLLLRGGIVEEVRQMEEKGLG